MKTITFKQQSGNVVTVNPSQVGAVVNYAHEQGGGAFAFVQGRKLTLSNDEAKRLTAVLTGRRPSRKARKVNRSKRR